LRLEDSSHDAKAATAALPNGHQSADMRRALAEIFNRGLHLQVRIRNSMTAVLSNLFWSKLPKAAEKIVII